MCRSVGGGTAGGVRTPPCGIGVCMRGGGQRVSDTSISDGGRLSPSSHSFHSPHPPFVQQQQSFPYVVVPHPLQVVPPGGTAAAVAAAIDHAVFTSPVSPPAFPTGVLPPPIGTPPSPCYGGCSCGASTASSPGACRVHERVITCPPPPPLVTCGAADRDSVHGALTGGDGELAVPCNDDQEVWPPRDDTSEEIKEESVKELLLSCSLTRRGGESMSECSVGCEPWRADQHPHNAHHGRDNTTPSSWTTFSNVVPFGSLQKQVSNMSLNLTAKIDEIQCHQHADTSAALHAIRTQLQELTKSVESCQSEVVEVKRDMVAIKHEIDTLQAAKEEIEELRDAVDRLEEQTRRRKIRLLEQFP